MSNKFTIIIDALDRSAGAFRSAGNGLAQIERRIEAVNRSFPRTSEVESFVARSTLLTGAMIAGGIGGVGLLTSKIFSIETAWANVVRGVSNKSLTLGMDFKQLYGIRTAAQSVGVSPEQATASVDSVSRGFYDSVQGRDPVKRAIYQAYNITGKDRFGNFTPETLLEQIAAAGEHVNRNNGPFARHRLFELLGADGLEDLLNKGEIGVRERYRAGLRTAPTDDDRRRAEEYAEAMSKLDAQFDKTKSIILGGLAPTLTSFLTNINTFVERATTGKSSAPERNDGDRVYEGAQMVSNYLKGYGYRTNEERDKALVGTSSSFWDMRHGVSHATEATNALFSSLERRNGLPQGLLDSVWAEESSRGENLRPSSKGALGHFQFMPDTARQYGLKNPNDLTESATAAATYLRDLLRLTGGSLPNALVAYNWGQGNLNRYGAAKAPKETQEYVADITNAMSHIQSMRLYPDRDGQASVQEKDTKGNGSGKSEGQLTVKVELGNLPAGSRTSVSSSPNVTSSVTSGSTGRTDQFALGATY